MFSSKKNTQHLILTALCSCLLLGKATWSQELEKTDATKATAKPAPKKVSEKEAEIAEEQFQTGRKLFFQGAYADAAKKLKAAVESNPSKTSYRMLLAKAYRFAKDKKQAISALEAVLKIDTEHVEAGLELAELLTTTKEPKRVVAILEPLLKFKHDYPIYHMLAEAHYANESLEKARKYFQEAIKLNSNNAQDHYQLGNIYLADKRFAKAATAYEAAQTRGISTGVFHYKLASVYFNLHRYLGRVTEAEIVGGQKGEISKDSYLLSAVPGKKNFFYIAGKRSAVYQVAKAQELGIDIFDIHFLNANIWLSARRYKQADEIYAGLTDMVKDADKGLYWYQWSQAALGLRKYDAYLDRLQKAIEAEPEVYKTALSDAYVTVANRYNGEGNQKAYLEYLAKAVKENPLSPRLHLMLGDALWLANKKTDAAAQYRLVLELEKNHSQRLRLLNRIRANKSAS